MKALIVALLLFCAFSAQAVERFVDFHESTEGLAIVSRGKVLDIMCHADEDEGVMMAVGSLQSDFGRVAGVTPEITPAPAKECIIIASPKSPLAVGLFESGAVSRADLEGKYEKYIITVARNPMEGVERALIIIGSDKRGTIYGIYSLSEQMGVSPWYWWADVPTQRRDYIRIVPGVFTDGEPKVARRGIFINDEWPSFGNWAVEHFGGINSECYRHVFELLLRLKANFMWPAMWGSAFYDDDPENGPLADRMGIIMGTSHHEPMALAQQDWKRRGLGEWNYARNERGLQDFWRSGIERAKDWETVITVGMRGDGDEAMEDSGNMALMEKIIADQRLIISDVMGRPASSVPQVWTLYKEVQDYYDRGMAVPDDVILLLCDDNWGNVRKLPPLGGSLHPGGYGMYYHVDYVGAPRNSKWINISPIPRIWEQMNLSYRYGVDKLWILNVGDLKPMEYPMTFFLDMAWDPDRFSAENLADHSINFCKDIFGEAHAAEAARILREYAKFNRRVTPELLDMNTYSLDHYCEWERATGEYCRLALDAEGLGRTLPDSLQSAWFQLIGYPVMASSNLYDMYYAQAMNNRLALAGDPLANVWGARVEDTFRKDAELTARYHAVNGGKWNHMMDQVHIGYTSWQQPEENVIPRVKLVDGIPTKPLDLPRPLAAVYPSPAGAPLFHGDDGFVSIEAEHFSRKTEGAEAQWTVIPDMGRTLSAVTPLPPTAPVDGMALEYDMEIPAEAEAEVIFRFCPTLNFNGTGLRYAVSFDGGEEQVVNINGHFDGETGNEWHREHVIDSRTVHSLKAGAHTLRYRPLDPALVLQKIIIDLGGLEDSYLGPPESLRK